MAGSLLPTPLFQLYHVRFGLSPAEISLVFAIYAGSLIPALLFLGGISDTIGRRRTILLAFLGMAISAIVFALASGLWWLVAARIVQGVAMGIGIGAGAAAVREWMDDADRPRAGEIIVISVSIGSAFGALLGGVLGQYAPYPSSIAYIIYIALVACLAVVVARVPACPHLQPTSTSVVIAIPPSIRRPFFLACAQVFIGWSTFSLFFSLVPSFLASALNLHNLVIGALVIAGLQAGSITASLAGGGLSKRIAIIASLVALGCGLWVLQIAVATHVYALIAVAALVTGAGGGLSYMAGLNIVAAISPPDRRAEMLSAFQVAYYLRFSIPALGVGIAANAFGLGAAFFGVTIALCAIALVVVAFTTERNLQRA